MPSKHDIDKKRLLSRRTFAAKSLAAQTDWLDEPLYDRDVSLWAADREVNSDLLAQTQRHLYKLRQDREAAEKALGDSHAWLERRQRALDEVKLLHALKMQNAQWDAPVQTQRCALNQLIISACTVSAGGNIGRTIATGGYEAIPSLLRLMADAALPMLARQFAAMVVGTIHGTARVEKLPIELRLPQLLTAYKFGAAHKVDEHSTLYNRFLMVKDGMQLAQRVRAARVAARWDYATETKAHEWLATGASPQKLAQLLENLQKAEAVKKRLKLLTTHDAGAVMAAELAKALDICVDSRDAELVPITCALFDKLCGILEARMKEAPYQRLVSRVMLISQVVQTAPKHLQADCLRLVELAARKLELPHQHNGKTGTGLFDAIAPKLEHDFEPIVTLLNWSQDVQLVRKAVELDVVGALAYHNEDRLDADTLTVSLQIIATLNATGCGAAGNVVPAVRACRGNPRARAELLNLVACIKESRDASTMFRCSIDAITEFKRFSLRQGIQILSDAMPRIAQLCRNSKDCWAPGFATSFVRLSLLMHHCYGEVPNDLLGAAIESLLDQRAMTCGHWDVALAAVTVATYLCDREPKQFRQIYQSAFAKRFTLDSHSWFYLKPLLEMPKLRDAIRRAFVHHPGSCANFFSQARLAHKLTLSITDACAGLEEDSNRVQCICEHCQRAAGLNDLAQAYWKRYVHAQQLTGAPHEMPHSVTKWLDMPADLSRELHYLEKKHPPAGRPEGVERRITKLRFYKQFPRTMEAEMQTHASHELEKTESLAYVHAAASLIQRAIQANSSLEQMEALGLSEDELFDLIVLRTTLNKSENKSELKRLLSACLRGDMQWSHRQTKNREFLSQMRARGFDADVWLAGFPAHVTIPAADGKPLRLSIEQNPIEVLKMGVYFNTCLSLDGVNAFSSIANATDLNKRVIYMRNSRGEPMARKLVAISEEWEMLGYEVYWRALRKPEGTYDDLEAALEAAMDQYAMELATRCGLPLGVDGEVPTLVSKSWYDDGAVGWPGMDKLHDMPMLCFGKKRGER